jgi:outer membrane protein OmpA-like peptidoglycan-associated protein
MFRRAGALGALAVAIACVALSPTSVEAQTSARLENERGMDLHLFRPAVDSKGILSTNGTDILGHLDFSFGLVLDAGFGILPYQGFVNDESVDAADAERTNRLVDSFFTGTLQANLGLFNVAVVGVQIPVQVVNGPNQTIPVTGTAPDGFNVSGSNGLSYQGLGDITIQGKFRFTRVERDPIGLGGLVLIELPTGNTSEFAGDGFALWPILAAELRPIRQIRLALNLGVRLNFADPATVPVYGRTCPGTGMTNATGAAFMSNGGCTAAPGTDTEYGHLLTFGLGAGFRIADPVEIALDVYGTQALSAFQAEGFNLETLLGLKIFVERNSYLVLGGGVGIPNIAGDTGGFQTADIRAMLGFIFEPSIGDRDGDGLKDDFDQCPDEPEDFDNFADEDGCPDPDNDRDGILDVDDECPMVPEDRDGDADEDGCPEGNEGDRDGDGILDQVDECPDDPEDRDGFQDEDGCPDPDNDQDGILDTDDLCPNDPEDRDNFEDEDGCPDPDNDQDRILDVDDSCPNDPETYNGFEDEDGCPDRGSVVIEENQIVILEKIYFETDSAVIQQRSYPIIDAVAATLNGNPQITLIEIQGHADERSSDEYNIRLTRDRAASVVEALVQRGVGRDRMRSGGYGERCPVDPRHNAEAWERNRRVEFKIIQTEDGPTGVEVACPAGRELIPN